MIAILKMGMLMEINPLRRNFHSVCELFAITDFIPVSRFSFIHYLHYHVLRSHPQYRFLVILVSSYQRIHRFVFSYYLRPKYSKHYLLLHLSAGRMAEDKNNSHQSIVVKNTRLNTFWSNIKRNPKWTIINSENLCGENRMKWKHPHTASNN